MGKLASMTVWCDVIARYFAGCDHSDIVKWIIYQAIPNPDSLQIALINITGVIFIFSPQQIRIREPRKKEWDILW